MDVEGQHRSSEAPAIRRIRDRDTHRATLGVWGRSGPLQPRDLSRQASTHKTGLSSPPTVPVNPFCPVQQMQYRCRFRAGPFPAQKARRGGGTASVTIERSLTIWRGDVPGKKKRLALVDRPDSSKRHKPLTALLHRERAAVWNRLPSSMHIPSSPSLALSTRVRAASATFDTSGRNASSRNTLPLLHVASAIQPRALQRLIRRHRLGRYLAFAGRFSNQRSSHSGPLHSYHRYTEPLFTTRSTSCSTRPHFGHSGMIRVGGMRTLAGSTYVVLISLPFNPATFLSPCSGPIASHITPPPTRTT